MAQTFDVLTVDPQGTKLVEASAGTGKTYSVAILVLRLLLEKKIPLEKILMVTFTKAATAELESRIRKFVRLAGNFASGLEITDQTIRNVVGTPDEEKREILRQAVQSLDSLSVMTIHSFCQKTIDEFTFETGQSFAYEIKTDDSEIFADAAYRFFREELNVLDPETLNRIWKDLKLEKMPELLRKHLAGMKFIDSELPGDPTTEDIASRIAEANQAMEAFLSECLPRILHTPKSRNNLLKEAEAGNWEEFKRRFREQLKKPAGYFVHYDFMKDDFVELDKAIQRSEAEGLNYYYLRFFRYAADYVRNVKEREGSISFDDQIRITHQALDNEFFRQKLSAKYDAVFVDEFQDTDHYQYEIFSRLFSDRSIVFYIGDPKQSIYGWRGADLDTYKQAKRVAGYEVYTMKRNYRSTGSMINALNTLLGLDGYNIFLDDDIHYIPVEQGANGTGELYVDGQPVKPVTIWEFEEDDYETNYRKIAQEILTLLDGNATIKGARVKPGDIGILVRENREGDAIKKELALLNIPAVKRDDTKVLSSEEASRVLYLLEAVVSPRRSTLNRALLSPWFGFDSLSIRNLDEDIHISHFLELRKTLNDEGIYNMIMSFLTRYGVRARCAVDKLGQRVLTNLNHLAEILHRVEKESNYTPGELMMWLRKNKENKNEEYEQRIESDDEAVQISTIHKAKGLEYKIVFAPCLSMIPKKKLQEKGNVNDFKRGGDYCFTRNLSALSKDVQELFYLQDEQENRRLVYVALTRAIYKCYISSVPRTYKGEPAPSTLSEILDRYPNNSDLIERINIPGGSLQRLTGSYQPDLNQPVFRPRQVPGMEIINTFRIHSFSALSKAHYSAPFEKQEPGGQSAYDQFIFQELGRGANVGTALHSIFERLNFADSSTWNQTLQDASKYYPNLIKQENFNLFTQLIGHTMQVTLHPDGKAFSLGEISNRKKLPELEFYFSMDKVNKAAVHAILDGEAGLSGEADLEGLMTGFIDLLFEHDGKYYILDWKSNHLGNTTGHYSRAALDEAMRLNNYNLQYMIYTIAARRWLASRIPGFDYDRHFGGIIYLFLRGLREGSQTGIFTAKPERSKIEQLEGVLMSR